MHLKIITGSWAVSEQKIAGHTPLILPLGRHMQVDLCEFDTTLVYRAGQPGQPTKQKKNEKEKKKIITGKLFGCQNPEKKY